MGSWWPSAFFKCDRRDRREGATHAEERKRETLDQARGAFVNAVLESEASHLDRKLMRNDDDVRRVEKSFANDAHHTRGNLAGRLVHWLVSMFEVACDVLDRRKPTRQSVKGRVGFDKTIVGSHRCAKRFSDNCCGVVRAQERARENEWGWDAEQTAQVICGGARLSLTFRA